MGAPELNSTQRSLLKARMAIAAAARKHRDEQQARTLTRPGQSFYRYLDGVEPDMRDYEMAGQVLALCEEVYAMLGRMQASISHTRLPVSLVVPADLLAFEADKCVQVIRHKQARMAFHERWRQPPIVRMLAERKKKLPKVAA
ncbi:hypothetical protein [Laribacter hongkongensis]|uniref:hypothetical protein n=1 Tax=Laribacter hongkongensis TaxID=168471 RepID=UPI001EFDC412|nr:hypothetical protein [Laribacter hongkongensis]MCG9096229.1 hypothetical protein [Laribacter hongkongensis]